MGDLSEDKSTVLVTGFGPFGAHKVNASWVAVQELYKLGLGNNVRLVIHEVPVEYDTVKKLIPELWKRYSPKLVVHVGVSSLASEITLEQQAHNDGYCREDVLGQCPEGDTCVNDCCDNTIVSCIDMGRVQECVNMSNFDIACVVSQDPGRYLCDFIYFTSLHINKECTAFIHVPPLNKPYTGPQLAKTLQVAIKAMLQQIQ